MKFGQLVIAIGMVLAALAGGVVLVEPGRASAAYLLLSDYFRLPGQRVSVVGKEFMPHEEVDVYLGSSTVHATADGSGAFMTDSIRVPLMPHMMVPVIANGASSAGRAQLHVGGFYPVVEPSTYYLLPGQTVSVTGRGYMPNETVDMVGHAGTTTTTFSLSANGEGAFSFGPVPVGYISGHHSARFTGRMSGATYSLTIHVAQLHPWIILSTYYAPSGSAIEVHGYGLGANEAAHLHVGGSESVSASAMTNNDGHVLFVTTIPEGGEGTVAFKIHGESTNAAASAMVTRAR